MYLSQPFTIMVLTNIFLQVLPVINGKAFTVRTPLFLANKYYVRNGVWFNLMWAEGVFT